MYLDALNTFSDAQAVTATALATSQVDLGASPTLRDLGAGEQIWLVVMHNHASGTALTDNSGTDGTIVITLESDSVATIDSSATVHLTSPTIAVGSGIASGTVLWRVPLPSTATYERYLGVRYTVANATLTNPSIDAFLTRDINAWTAYPDAITIV